MRHFRPGARVDLGRTRVRRRSLPAKPPVSPATGQRPNDLCKGQSFRAIGLWLAARTSATLVTKVMEGGDA